ncbi:MAG: hypothetical protein JO008_06895 [Alphaproteobacteria bacterium]|nr:hypothetical protein [Alphaproteobacteria bacterium]
MTTAGRIQINRPLKPLDEPIYGLSYDLVATYVVRGEGAPCAMTVDASLQGEIDICGFMQLRRSDRIDCNLATTGSDFPR